jgi:DNA-binding transcriptional ArsR family regulator
VIKVRATEVKAKEAKEYNHNRLSDSLEWDWGTAYDLILSLRSLFHPKEYGLPPPWAAGVRKRLSSQSQRDLKDFFSPAYGFLVYMPLHLILEMDAPKNGEHLLSYLEQIPEQEFSRRMCRPVLNDEELTRITANALAGEEISEVDMEEYRRGIARSHVTTTPTAAEVRRVFAEMKNPEMTKQRWISAVREYYEAFFAEEEKRLAPTLEKMVEQAQETAKTASVPDLIERLSNGFTISKDIDLSRLVLVPSIWSHPFVTPMELSERELCLVWGAHPSGFKLVPGESVPNDAMLVLKAMNDPTRLRLLRLIANKPRSLISLSQEVKLSLPTVSHHIRELRGAGLIRLEVGGKGRENKYTVRWQSAQAAFEELEQFVMRKT